MSEARVAWRPGADVRAVLGPEAVAFVDRAGAHMAPAAGRLAFLDGLRGVAAATVVLLHGTLIFAQGWAPRNAYLAVDFFFLLSGYVLARSFDDRLAQGRPWAFVRGRLLRLYPLVLVGAGLGLVMLCCASIFNHSRSLSQVALDFVCALMLVPAPPIVSGQWQAYSADPPLWSLFYELAVNVVYALIAPRLTTRRLVGLVCVSGVVLAIAIIIHHSADFSLDYFQYGGLRVMFPFFLGVTVFRWLRDSPPRWRLPAWSQGVIALALGAVLLSPAPLNAPYALAAIFLAFPALLIASLHAEPLRGWARATCLFLGLLSYPIYVVHNPLFRLISGLAFHNAQGLARLAGLALSLIVVVAASWILARFYDEPVRRWLTARSVAKSAIRSSFSPSRGQGAESRRAS